jgi:TolB protein
VFASWPCDASLIYAVNSDGTGLTLLASNRGTAWTSYPTWSPDGRRIVFASDRGAGDRLYVMNADGSGLTQLMDMSVYPDRFGWSSDGSRIVFQSYNPDPESDEVGQIYAVNSDGTGLTRLTSLPAGAGAPVWQPGPASREP